MKSASILYKISIFCHHFTLSPNVPYYKIYMIRFLLKLSFAYAANRNENVYRSSGDLHPFLFPCPEGSGEKS